MVHSQTIGRIRAARQRNGIEPIVRMTYRRPCDTGIVIQFNPGVQWLLMIIMILVVIIMIIIITFCHIKN